ncbi:MAG: hypothetical protein R3B09_00605 [Nannocystaceae bacterium]
MPKFTHEALVQLVRNAPSLLVDLLWPEGSIPARRVHVTRAEFVDLNLSEYRADGVIVVGADPDDPDAALVGEVQTGIDPRKRRRWPVYVTSLFARLGCPVDLVVLTLDREVAAWASRPIVVGTLPGALTVTPTVIGPDQIPRITDLEAARRAPELAVLSAVAHGDEEGAGAIAFAALAASRDLDNDHSIFYVDLVLHHLGPAARALLEELMATANYEFQSDFARRYYTEGKSEGILAGEALLLLRLLERKGIALSDDDRERVLRCTECAQLEAWADRLLTATGRDDIFDPE